MHFCVHDLITNESNHHHVNVVNLVQCESTYGDDWVSNTLSVSPAEVQCQVKSIWATLTIKRSFYVHTLMRNIQTRKQNSMYWFSKQNYSKWIVFIQCSEQNRIKLFATISWHTLSIHPLYKHIPSLTLSLALSPSSLSIWISLDYLEADFRLVWPTPFSRDATFK